MTCAEKIERPTAVTLYGQPHTVTPRLVSKKFGNGKKLIGLAPLNTLPNY